MLPGDDVSPCVVGVHLLVPMSHFSMVAASFFGRLHLLLMSVTLLLILVPGSTYDTSFSFHHPIGLLSSLGKKVSLFLFVLSYSLVFDVKSVLCMIQFFPRDEKTSC